MRLPLILAGMLMCQSVTADTVNARFPRDRGADNRTFVRMFPNLPAFADPNDSAMRAALQQLGRKGGPLDANDDLSDPLQSIINQPDFSPNNLDNPEMTAGVTFIGQFIDHDLTFDRRSALNRAADPTRTINSRTAAFDLDSVYAGGPEKRPDMFETTATGIKFRIDSIPGSAEVSRNGVSRDDLPRDTTGVALIGDSRNDEHVILSQLHLAFMKLHNEVTEQLMSAGDVSAQAVFEQARQAVQWHYQWIVLNEFLPMTIGQEMVDDIVNNGARYYQTPQPRTRRAGNRENGRNGRSRRAVSPAQIPIEFSVAAYRFGHSQVRPSYRLNFGADDDSQFFAFILDNRLDPHSADPDDLRGGRRAARRFVDWQTFFDFEDGNVRPNKRIDAQLTTNLFELPGVAVPAPGLPSDGEISLPSRNLLRHLNFGLPSGQAVANLMQVPVLSAEQLSDVASFGMDTSTPLWYYILKEAEVLEEGLRLGPVGGRIVGEVIIGLLRADPNAYINADSDWTPWLPTTSDSFSVTDLLNAAGVVTPL